MERVLKQHVRYETYNMQTIGMFFNNAQYHSLLFKLISIVLASDA